MHPFALLPKLYGLAALFKQFSLRIYTTRARIEMKVSRNLLLIFSLRLDECLPENGIIFVGLKILYSVNIEWSWIMDRNCIVQ